MRKTIAKHIDHNVSIDILYSGAVTLNCNDCETLLTMWKLENENEENDWRKAMNNLMTKCPRHEDAYDCTPFCDVCEGNQEYEWTPFRRCVKCPTGVEHDVWFEEFGMCLECSNEYFTDDESEEK